MTAASSRTVERQCIQRLMLIFVVDTEFTDFNVPELISIALVTEDGQHEFYAELPVNREKCNTFVIETVLPQLGTIDGAQCTADELCDRLNLWLAPFARSAPVICFDYDGDWRLAPVLPGVALSSARMDSRAECLSLHRSAGVADVLHRQPPARPPCTE